MKLLSRFIRFTLASLTISSVLGLAMPAFALDVSETLLKVSVESVSGLRTEQVPQALTTLEFEALKRDAERGNAAAQLSLAIAHFFGNGVPKDRALFVRWCDLAAKQGHREAEYLLAGAYDAGYGVAEDAQQALYWYQRASDHGYIRGTLALANLHLRLNHSKTAFEIVQSAAATGDPGAEYELGLYYTGGYGTKRDRQQAVAWWDKAARHNHAEAQWMLGHAYAAGDGVEQDATKAAHWFICAADQGHSFALIDAAAVLAKGKGVPENFPKAVHYWRQASMQGSLDGLYSLGWAYCYGKGVPQDHSEAVRLLSTAANREHPLSMNLLATCYRNGWGIPKNFLAARNLYEQAAGYLMVTAMFNLGSLYLEGEPGVGPNYRLALDWYLKAATYNHPGALNDLACMYKDGLGVNRDLIEASKWAFLAADHGIATCRQTLKEVEEVATPDQLTEGRKRATAWAQDRAAAVRIVPVH